MRVRFFPPKPTESQNCILVPSMTSIKGSLFQCGRLARRQAVNLCNVGSNPTAGASETTNRWKEMNSESWKLEAKCHKEGMRPDFFYPTAPSGRSTQGTLDSRQAAVANYCHGLDDKKPCPVRIQCLNYALNTRQDDGVWGGTTENERERIRRQRRKLA